MGEGVNDVIGDDVDKQASVHDVVKYFVRVWHGDFAEHIFKLRTELVVALNV
jgi:hypothetical protein